MRAKPPSPAYPVPAAYPTSQQPPTPSIFRRVLAALFSPVRRFLSWLIQPSTTWCRPLVHRRWLHQNMDYRMHHFLLPDSVLKHFSTKHRYSGPSDSFLPVIPSLSDLSLKGHRPKTKAYRLRTRYFTTSTSQTPHIAGPRLPRQILRSSWSSRFHFPHKVQPPYLMAVLP